jgi:ABC-type microcin C transport system permease subunit YejE
MSLKHKKFILKKNNIFEIFGIVFIIRYELKLFWIEIEIDPSKWNILKRVRFEINYKLLSQNQALCPQTKDVVRKNTHCVRTPYF